MPERVDWLVVGTVVTMDDRRRVNDDGAVELRGERIVAVGAASELRSRFRAAQVAGGPRKLVIPGLIDCHNHIGRGGAPQHA